MTTEYTTRKPSHWSHCDLCGRKVDDFDPYYATRDGYTGCCGELVCESGIGCVVVVTDIETIHFQSEEDAKWAMEGGE